MEKRERQWGRDRRGNTGGEACKQSMEGEKRYHTERASDMLIEENGKNETCKQSELQEKERRQGQRSCGYSKVGHRHRRQ